tara:strand:- start:947 stop:1249 length:303 start_codon:yes stop_codon:yes gene_type:complete
MDIRDIIFSFSQNDLAIENGDFVIGNSDQQNIRNIIQSQRGQFYEQPLIGVGILDEMNSSATTQSLKNRIKTNLLLDNYEADEIQVGKHYELTVSAKKTK